MKLAVLLPLLLMLAEALVVARVAATAFRLHRGARKRRMLARSREAGCAAMYDVGISVLVDGMPEPERIERLLSVDCMRYEVIVVVRHEEDSRALSELLHRYALVRVNFVPTDELAVDPACRLYRSRQRRYRRLVVVEQPDRPDDDACNCGVVAATYEWVLPLPPGVELLDDATACLEAGLHEQAAAGAVALTGWILPASLVAGQRLVLLKREAILDEGGFAHDSHPGERMIRMLRRRPGHGGILHLDLPLGRRTACPPPMLHAGWRMVAMLGAMAAGVLLIAALPRREALLGIVLILSVYTTLLLLAALGYRAFGSRVTAESNGGTGLRHGGCSVRFF